MGIFSFIKSFWDAPSSAPEAPMTEPAVERVKTQYRIITIQDQNPVWAGERALQFKHGDEWLYIPDGYAYVLDKHFFPEFAPRCRNGCGFTIQSDGDLLLTYFATKWPYIEDYFANLRRKREKYLEKQAKLASKPTTYL
jgi:hypothetical protein